MEDPYPFENIKRLCVFMFQTWDNSQLLRRELWISAELTIVSSLEHKNTQPLYIFNRVRVLHLNRLNEGTWLHSFGCCWSGLPPLYSFGAFRESVIQRIWCKCVQLYCGIRLNVQTTSVVWFTQLWSFRTKLDWQYYKECPKEPRPDC